MNSVGQKTMRLHISIIFAGSIKKILTMLFISVVYWIMHQSYLLNLSINIKGIIIASMIVSISRSYFFWKNFSYRFDDGHLIINSGIWFKKNRSIALNRICNIDIRISFWQRLFGVVEMRMDTEGGEREALIKLTAVKHEEVKRIKAIINYKETSNTSMWEQRPSAIVLYGITTMKLGYFISLIMFIYFQMGFVRENKNIIAFEQGLKSLNLSMQIGIILSMIIITSLILSIFFTFFQYHRFRINVHEQGLQIKRGLINTHTVTIKLDSIAAIRIEESLLREPFQVCTVYLDCIGGGNEEESSSTILIPWIRKKMVTSVLYKLFPEWDFTMLEKKVGVPDSQLYVAPSRSLLHFLWLKFILNICFTLALEQIPILQPYMFFLAAASSIIIIIWCYLQYKDQMVAITSRTQLFFSTRFINKKTIIINRNSLQQINYASHSLQAISHLTNIVFYVRTSALKRKHVVRNLNTHSISPVALWFSSFNKELYPLKKGFYDTTLTERKNLNEKII